MIELTPDEILSAAATIAGNMFLNAAIAEARARKAEAELAALQNANGVAKTQKLENAFFEANS